ncbi:MAG: HEPN domain-containing protein [Cellulomonas sp.]|uniref:HEPN domain-containing protein n=1 Tax=Cellulomonas sp. 73-92 TaxID=1895740 RepID=UPI000B12BE82|nr:HEPN domain-containing protein [Cellulomonas sp. 73-92]MBN9376101.1 HEPN domain-containing protein [Cellulomonas sp.]
MVSRWERGRAEVDQLLTQARLTRVEPNRELADSYLDQARAHLSAAAAVTDLDAAGAFVLAYDAARLALAAVLVNQGLRPRGEGAHAVLLEAVLAQLEPPRQQEFREFDWMRRLRNDTQYPDADRPTAVADDVAQAIPAAQAILERAALLLDHMPPY